MHNMSSQRTWDKIMSDYGLDEMSDEFWEDDIGNLADIELGYVATVRRLKKKTCCVCSGYYEKELTKEDKDYLAQVREEYDIKFHPDVNIDEFHAGIKIK